ncbi:hypothetical protein KBC04_00540 [Candidatus Babeliales bacterium]|nr:hypothetical protein [Candidatus Babeliales bacterium]MBP9843421.1 hypothetical protein [Candidatus Babeliales bacterium]
MKKLGVFLAIVYFCLQADFLQSTGDAKSPSKFRQRLQAAQQADQKVTREDENLKDRVTVVLQELVAEKKRKERARRFSLDALPVKAAMKERRSGSWS